MTMAMAMAMAMTNDNGNSKRRIKPCRYQERNDNNNDWVHVEDCSDSICDYDSTEYTIGTEADNATSFAFEGGGNTNNSVAVETTVVKTVEAVKVAATITTTESSLKEEEATSSSKGEIEAMLLVSSQSKSP